MTMNTIIHAIKTNHVANTSLSVMIRAPKAKWNELVVLQVRKALLKDWKQLTVSCTSNLKLNNLLCHWAHVIDN